MQACPAPQAKTRSSRTKPDVCISRYYEKYRIESNASLHINTNINPKFTDRARATTVSLQSLVIPAEGTSVDYICGDLGESSAGMDWCCSSVHTLLDLLCIAQIHERTEMGSKTKRQKRQRHERQALKQILGALWQPLIRPWRCGFLKTVGADRKV